MNSYEYLDNMRGLWRQLGEENQRPAGGHADSQQIIEKIIRNERRSLVSNLVRRHIVLGILGIAVIPADMLLLYKEMGLVGYLAIILSIYGVLAGCCALWVAWQARNFNYGDMTMREAWHKANIFYKRRNMLRNISLCIGIPLIILLIMALNDSMGRPAMVGGIVGAIIGGIIGVYQNYRTQQQLRAMRDSFEE